VLVVVEVVEEVVVEVVVCAGGDAELVVVAQVVRVPMPVSST